MLGFTLFSKSVAYIITEGLQSNIFRHIPGIHLFWKEKLFFKKWPSSYPPKLFHDPNQSMARGDVCSKCPMSTEMLMVTQPACAWAQGSLSTPSSSITGALRELRETGIPHFYNLSGHNFWQSQHWWPHFPVLTGVMMASRSMKSGSFYPLSPKSKLWHHRVQIKVIPHSTPM